MNGPGTDSLEIRHTPGTIPGGARPGWGLPFRQLPAATRRDLTPESVISKQVQTGRQQIQDKYALQWKEVNRSRRFIGAAKTSAMLREIDTRAKQEMLQFNQQAQQQMEQLQNIDRLAQQGMPDADKIKARIVFGTDVAERMYPEPAKERTVPQQFGELDVYSHRISQELEWFKEDKPSKFPLAYAFAGPLMTGPLAAYRGLRKPKRKVQIYDPATDGWKKAEPEEIARYDMLLQEEKNITQRKTELLGRPGISRRRVQPGTKGGTFDDKIAESVRPQRQQRRQPTATELRQRGTREAYEKGKQLGYWR